MAELLHCRTDRSGRMRATLVAVALLCACCCAAFAQGEWRSTPVVSELWLGGSEPVDEAAAPAVVITGEGLIYVAFSLRGGEWHYYTKDHPSARGTFSAFSPLFSPRGGTPVSGAPANLLALDSGSVLHYITAFETPESCLQYGGNRLNDTILTSFSYLENVGPDACGVQLGRAAIAADARGTLHMVCTIDDRIFYFSRFSGVWSAGIPISDPSVESMIPSIAVTPAGQVHVVFLSRPFSPGQDMNLNYVSGSGDRFSDPVILDGGQGEQVSYPSLTVDAEGVCHLAYVDYSNLPLYSLRYANNRGGGWNKSEVVLENGLYVLGYISLAADRYGAMHIVGNYSTTHPDSLADANLFYIRNAGDGWSEPVRITGNGTNDFAFNQGNGFVALRDSMLAVVYTSRDRDDKVSIMLAQHDIDFDPQPRVESDTVSFGSRYADADSWSLDTSIVVRNGGPSLYRALRLNDVRMLDAEPSTLVLTPAQMPDDVRGGESAPLGFSVKGSGPGPFSMRIAIESNGGSDTVVLVGTMLKPAPVARVLQLGSDTIEVGSLASVTCTVTPPLTEADEVRSVSLRIHFPARSLFPRRVVLADQTASALLSSSYDGAGTLSITLSGKNGAALQGEKLFTVELEGLLTGEFVNEMKPDPDSIPDLFNPEVLSGWVYLHGCDVGTDLHFGKAGFAGRIAPNPVKEVLSFEYVAPAEIPVSVYLVDLLGTEYLATPLPAGTGEPQQAGIQLGALPPGLYFVRLRVGERVVTDMMIKE